MSSYPPSMTAKEVAQELARSAENFCRKYLASGEKRGDRWYVGDPLGQAASNKGSCVVELGGSKAGVWLDGANGEGGDLLKILQLQMNNDTKAAYKEALQFLGRWREPGDQTTVNRSGQSGLSDRRTARSTLSAGNSSSQKKEQPPRDEGIAPKVDWKPIAEGSLQWKYLVEERCVNPEVLKEYRIGMGSYFFPERSETDDAIVFPAYSADGNRVLMVKYLALTRKNGKQKVVQCNKGAIHHLIGMDAASRRLSRVDGDSKNVNKGIVICEGEIDMLSAASEGFASVSVPFGAKADKDEGQRVNRGNKWIENDWDWLESQDEYVLALDADTPGRDATETLLRRLPDGAERCRVVKWNHENDDVNEVMLRDPLEMIRCIDAAAPVDPEALKRASQYRDKIWEKFFPSGGMELGDPVPWAVGFPFRFRPGEVTVWTGYSKHGKTVMQTYQMVFLASLGRRCCIASLELSAHETLGNAMRMATGRSKPIDINGDPDIELFDKAIRWLDEAFFIYDKVGTVSLDDVLRVFGYCARRYGVSHFVIDSLMKLDVREDDNDRQKEVLNLITAFAARYDVHVHLVAHSKKPSEKKPEHKSWPKKHDVLGSVHITNIAHNTVVVYRNKQKEMNLQLAIASRKPQADIDEIEKMEDALFIVDAQRGGEGDLPIRRLWFDHGGSWQYMEKADDLPVLYVR